MTFASYARVLVSDFSCLAAQGGKKAAVTTHDKHTSRINHDPDRRRHPSDILPRRPREDEQPEWRNCRGENTG